MTNRAQGHTLEAIVGALLLLAAISFALQMTAVTPLSASTSSQHIENQLQGTAEGILASAADTGDLKDAVLYWNNETQEFHNADEPGYFTTYPPNISFGDMLNRSFDQQRIAYNVYITYQSSSGTIHRNRFIYSGEPSDHAISASHIVALTDGEVLRNATGHRDFRNPIEDPLTNFYIPDTTSGGLYNLVKVEVVAWRI